MEGMTRRKWLGILTVSLLVGAAAGGAYYHFIYFPEKQEEERIRSLMEYAGLTKEEAIRFDKNFKEYAPYNQTLLDFAYFLKKYPLTTSEIFRRTNSFPTTVISLKNVKPIISEIVTGDQKGRDFVLRYPFLVLDDGLNATDAELMLYDLNMKDLTSHIIEKIKDQSSRVTTLRLLFPNIQNRTLTEDQALDFIRKHPELLPLNSSSLVLAKHWPKVSDLVAFLLGKYSIDIAKDSILLLYPNIQNGTLTTESIINFITAYSDLVKNGINQEDLPYVKFYHIYPTLTDSVIKNLPRDIGIQVIHNLVPFLLNKTFTENIAAHFISLYPALARSFGSHKDFPRLVYLFTQIPKSVDIGIKTIEDFDFLVNTLNSVLRYVDETKKKEEKIAFFMERHPELIRKYNWDEGTRKIFEFHGERPGLAHTLLTLGIERDHILSTIHNIRPYLKEIPESVIDDFIRSYKHFVQDGLDEKEARLLPHHYEYRALTETAIKEIGELESILFVLDSYHPYIKAKEISSLRLRRYILDDPKLFRVKEYVCPRADPDEDDMNNITEMIRLKDIFLGSKGPRWNPTKIINDKVYEGNVYIRVRSVRGGLEAELYWEPINYPQFPLEVQLRAFPNETRRKIALIPVNENLIESLVLIEGIKGGREYRIVVPIRDKKRSITEEIKTPYIREFENIAPLDDILLLASYYGIYLEKWHWDAAKCMPLLGQYNSLDDIVITKHIDWATGHGIDGFLFSWTYKDLRPDEVLKIFLASILSDQIKIGVLWEPHRFIREKDRDWVVDWDSYYDENLQILKEDAKFLAETLFNSPACLKIDNKPVVYFVASAFWSNKSKNAIKEVRDFLKREYNLEVFLFSDHMHPAVANPYLALNDPSYTKKIEPYDGITVWGEAMTLQ